jgi:hypothetical protein
MDYCFYTANHLGKHCKMGLENALLENQWAREGLGWRLLDYSELVGRRVPASPSCSCSLSSSPKGYCLLPECPALQPLSTTGLLSA